MNNSIISPDDLNLQLKKSDIENSGIELYGLLSGFICGGLTDQSWKILLYQLTNESKPYPDLLMGEIEKIYQHITRQLESFESVTLGLNLPNSNKNAFERADALYAWTNQFLLGLGLSQPKLEHEQGEIKEAINDLKEICQLGYDENDNPHELVPALEEIIEYLNTIAILLYTHFKSAIKPEQSLH